MPCFIKKKCAACSGHATPADADLQMFVERADRCELFKQGDGGFLFALL